MPADPTKPDLYSKAGLEAQTRRVISQVVYTQMPYQNVTLYAVWSPDHYALIFRNSEGEVIQSTDYLVGASLAEAAAPEAPAKTGYRFTGWSQKHPVDDALI
ncbi:MAG: InlB B-repeat-containing protein [Desulfobacterales bacterium]|nr:InlB B-repeat-containing protein [Desulfobacterales bacterium]